jgi:RNA polymerase sigma-70 factor (ECF subfamily)
MRKDTAKFEDAYNRYSDELFRHCYLRISDRDRALEITQEAFFKTWDYMQKGNTVDELRPFLYRTLKNLIIDEYRKVKSRSLEAMVGETEGASIENLLPPDESNTLEAAIERFDGVRALKALEQLTPLYKEALMMRYVDGLSPKEIAQEIGETENTVSVRVHRALKKMKDILELNPDTSNAI